MTTQKEIKEFLGSYLKGQMIIVIILAALYGVGLQLVGLPFGLGIGILTGLLSFVPYLGFLSGLLSSTGVILFLYASQPDRGATTELLFWVLGVFLVVQILESLVITPKILGRRTGFGSLATLGIILLGGIVLGPIGVMIAVPLAGIFRIIYLRNRKEINKSAKQLEEKKGEPQ